MPRKQDCAPIQGPFPRFLVSVDEGIAQDFCCLGACATQRCGHFSLMVYRAFIYLYPSSDKGKGRGGLGWSNGCGYVTCSVDTGSSAGQKRYEGCYVLRVSG